jgi:pyrimidine-nucleoside phosphorylase
MVDLIEKKKAGDHLTKDEIKYFINGYVANEIPDYQVSALLMAIVFQGMDDTEIFNLTDAMLHSGETVNLSSIKGVKVDKHSTGGVGDKVSLVLGPMVAACGAKLAKMSGRGLGHTGGTLDKLESIPGMKTKISIDQFKKQVDDIGIAIIGQTDDLDPADKKLYALRDVTGTVGSMALIASSIMSKKLASGADTILLDVKFGDGAFMTNLEDARKLATLMVNIGKYFGKDTRAEISDMGQPLGFAVGNILEVKEAIDALHGKGPQDLQDICLASGSTMLMQAQICKSVSEAKELLQSKINTGDAFNKFRQMVIAQGGDVSFIDNPSKFPMALYKQEVKATQSGYVSAIGAKAIGLDAMRLGAGREKADDKIDYTAGIVLSKKIGDHVIKGDTLATLYTERPSFDRIAKDIYSRFVIVDKPVQVPPIILDLIK